MMTIALTGGMGSGKSTVARLFRMLGVPVFEADREARTLQDHDPALREAIAARFGQELYAGGTLDRKALAVRVFGRPAELGSLNALVHPAVRRAFDAWCAEQCGPYVIMEAAVLVENGGHARFDRIVVVEAPEAQRVARVMQRDGLAEGEVQARLKHQATDQERGSAAHFNIINDGSRLVIPQVIAIHEQLIALST